MSESSTKPLPVELQSALTRLLKFGDGLKKCFVERDHIIDLLIMALACKQHFLLFAKPGTAKTALFSTACRNITNATDFQIEFSMFMTDTAVMGPYDVRKMREDGDLEHKVDGMLPQANIARFGEFLDANLAVQRSMLGAIHERKLVRGKQVVEIPLITVMCDTNVDPGVHLKKHPEAWAVLDRLLFMFSLDYLTGAGSVAEMLTGYQEGRFNKFSDQVSLEELNLIASVIVDPPSLFRIDGAFIIMKLSEAYVEYRRQRAQLIQGQPGLKVILPEISDRRLCIASMLAEYAAVRAGRENVEGEDLRLIKYGIGTTQSEFDLWDRIINTKIPEIEEEKSQQLDQAQHSMLTLLGDKLDGIDVTDIKKGPSAIKDIQTQVDGIIPKDDRVRSAKEALQQRVNATKSALQQAVLEDAGIT